MARPFKKLPRKTILNNIQRIRSRNNRLWRQLWEIALETPKGRIIWRKIADNDERVIQWSRRV
jgi:hypothetical protein